MPPSPSRSLLHLHLLFGRRRRRRHHTGNGTTAAAISNTGSGGGGGGGVRMGCAQGKPSRGSPARSDGRGLDRLMRDNGYLRAAAAAPAAGASRLSDPLPAAVAAAERAPPAAREHQPARRAGAAGASATFSSGRNTERAPPDDAASTTTTAAMPPLPPPPRREDELVDGWPTWLLDNVPREALHGIVPKSADAYDKIEKVGQGTYSNVYKARERGTGRVVALKKVRFDTSESESVRFMAREIRILQQLDHPNVLKLEGIATSRMHRSIYLVFEFMYSDLARLVARDDPRLTQPQIKRYMQQLLSGLQHCHERGILHRDIKGSNLLIDRHGVLKIGDFGLANYYGGAARRRPLTSRVVTLWYRAPELLLGSTDYGVGIDLWSAGCLLAEMFSGKPLMPGRTEVEQLVKIFTLCGSPPEDYWRKMRFSTSFRPPKTYRPTMPERFRDLPPPALPLLATLLAFDPAARGTAALALQSAVVADPAASRKPKLRQRSHRRKEGRQKDEEWQADQVPKIASHSPDRKEEGKETVTANSGQGADGNGVAGVVIDASSGQGPEGNGVAGVGVDASSGVQEPSGNAIVNAPSSTVSKRFSVTPVHVLRQEASPAAVAVAVAAAPQDQDQQLRREPSPAAASPDQHPRMASSSQRDAGAGEDDRGGHQPPPAPGGGGDGDGQAEGEPEPPPDGGGDVVSMHGLSLEETSSPAATTATAAAMTDFDAAAAVLRASSGDLPSSKQFVLVDHV
ncbi:hypothetical protein ACP4OV_013793 [Aristida adscensionis]